MVLPSRIRHKKRKKKFGVTRNTMGMVLNSFKTLMGNPPGS